MRALRQFQLISEDRRPATQPPTQLKSPAANFATKPIAYISGVRVLSTAPDVPETCTCAEIQDVAKSLIRLETAAQVCASTFGGARISAAHAVNGSAEVLVEVDYSGAAWDSLRAERPVGRCLSVQASTGGRGEARPARPTSLPCHRPHCRRLNGYHGSQSPNRMTSHAVSERYGKNGHTRGTRWTWLTHGRHDEAMPYTHNTPWVGETDTMKSWRACNQSWPTP
jgi:hypothetical protein